MWIKRKTAPVSWQSKSVLCKVTMHILGALTRLRASPCEQSAHYTHTLSPEQPFVSSHTGTYSSVRTHGQDRALRRSPFPERVHISPRLFLCSIEPSRSTQTPPAMLPSIANWGMHLKSTFSSAPCLSQIRELPHRQHHRLLDFKPFITLPKSRGILTSPDISIIL